MSLNSTVCKLREGAVTQGAGEAGRREGFCNATSSEAVNNRRTLVEYKRA